MFGLFKKKISDEDLGQIILHYVNEFVSNDAGMALGKLFGSFDKNEIIIHASKMGITKQDIESYIRLFSICAIDAAISDFNTSRRDLILVGAAENYARPTSSIFDTLSVIERARLFRNEEVDQIYSSNISEYEIIFLKQKYISYSYAIFILSVAIDGKMSSIVYNRDSFRSFWTSISSSIATVYRAKNTILKKFVIK